MMTTVASAPIPRLTSYLSPPAEGLPAPTIVPPFLGIVKILCDRVVNHELQPVIENLVRNFNLVGVVMSRVTLIY